MSKVTILAYHIRSASLQLEDCTHLITPARLNQLKRFRPDDQLRSLCGDLLVLNALTEQISEPLLPLQYAVIENGKPYLPSFPDFHFNVSHSGDWVLCAFGNLPIGIDIQQERPVKSALLRRALSTQEQTFLNTINSAERLSTFFDLWCLKESYCKATGLGLKVPLNSFTVSLHPVSVSDNAYCVSPVPFSEQGYHVGLCVKGNEVPQVELNILTHIK